MEKYLILFIPLVFLILYGIIKLSIISNKTYTHAEWEDQCEKDFKKYGPVPDDEE